MAVHSDSDEAEIYDHSGNHTAYRISTHIYLLDQLWVIISYIRIIILVKTFNKTLYGKYIHNYLTQIMCVHICICIYTHIYIIYILATCIYILSFS